MSDLPRLSRRDWLTLSAAGVVAGSVSGWFGALARAVGPLPRKRHKSVILLWMNGGPSQMDTFDLKPGHKNGGPFKEMSTNVTGVKISEHLPKLARHVDKMAIIRSMTSKEGDHGRATHLMHTGYLPGGGVNYPALGAIVSKELQPARPSLPGFVSIAPYRFFSPAAYNSGFLGPQYAPLLIGDNFNFAPRPGGNDYDQALKVRDITPSAKLSAEEVDSRLGLLRDLEKGFADERPDTPPKSHVAAYESAVRLMKTEARKAFNLDEEKAQTRDAYGRNLFGQGCLLARRLVEKGVPFVEVTLGGNNGIGWDTHGNNFDQVKALSGMLDPAWAALMGDLKERGLLSSTLVVWMGEFGRTPAINGGNGRDHWPNTWTAVLAGGGIKAGQAYGATTKDGTAVEKKPTTVPDLMATIVQAIGINPEKQHTANGRPIRVVDKGGRAIADIVG